MRRVAKDDREWMGGELGRARRTVVVAWLERHITAGSISGYLLIVARCSLTRLDTNVDIERKKDLRPVRMPIIFLYVDSCSRRNWLARKRG